MPFNAKKNKDKDNISKSEIKNKITKPEIYNETKLKIKKLSNL